MPESKRESSRMLFQTEKVCEGMESVVATPYFTQGDWPSREWWTLFEDPQLGQFIQMAIKGNPDFSSAIARTEIAKAEADELSSYLKPELKGDFSRSWRHLSSHGLERSLSPSVPASLKPSSLSLDFEYEIDLFGKYRNQFRAAKGRALAEAAQQEATFLMLTTLLAESYIEYAAHLKLIEHATEIEKLRLLNDQLVSLQVAHGVRDQFDLIQSKALYLESQESVITLHREKEKLLSRLKILMGLGPEAALKILPPTLSFKRTFPFPQSLPLNLLARRPDLMAHIELVKAAASKIKMAKADFYPNINLAASFGVESLKWHQLFSPLSFASAITPALSLPLFKGGKLRSALDKEYARYDEAVSAYNARLLQAVKEVKDQISHFVSANETRSLLEALYQQREESYGLMEERCKQGISNQLTLLDAKIEQLAQKMEAIRADHAYYLASLHLIKALGGGYGEPEE